MSIVRKPVVTADGVVIMDEFGREVPDPTPLRIPAGAKRPPNLMAQIQRLVQDSVSEYASQRGFETFEEADDFDVDDDFDPSTPYEEFYDPVLQRGITPQEFKANPDRYKDMYLGLARNLARHEDEQARYEAAKNKRARKPAKKDSQETGGGGSAPA